MGVGLVECDTDDCDTMIPDPPQPVRDKYGGAYCEECRKHIKHLGRAPDEEEDDEDFVVGNDNIKELQEDVEDARKILDKMENDETIVDVSDEENDENERDS